MTGEFDRHLCERLRGAARPGSDTGIMGALATEAADRIEHLLTEIEGRRDRETSWITLSEECAVRDEARMHPR